MPSGSFEAMSKRHEFIKAQPSDECGCPEEEWVMEGLYTIIHLEPDGSGHIFIDCGDWEDEKLVNCNCIESLRLAAEKWTGSIPVNNDL